VYSLCLCILLNIKGPENGARIAPSAQKVLTTYLLNE
jgi:hypothetical protein